MGLHFGGHTTANRDLTAANRGNCAMQGCDTPATRRQRASHGAKPLPATGLENAGGTEDTAAVPVSSARAVPQPATRHEDYARAQHNSPNSKRTRPLRYKTLPAHPFSPHVRYKTLLAHPPSPHVRYKTLLARPKWLNLALFLHAGRVLYRFG